MMNFTATHTFISTGAKTAMYTLREAGYFTTEYGTAYADFYITNLSNDKDTAIEKAAKISNEYDLPFRTDGELFSLNEIKRRAAEEVEAQRVAREKAEQEKIQQEQEFYEISLSEGMILVGKYAGRTIDEVVSITKGYIEWLSTQYNEGAVSAFNVGAKLAHDWVKANVKDSEYVGTVGEKITVTGEVKTTRSVSGFYGTTRMVVVATENGELVKLYSTAKAAYALREGDNVSITGKVKSHEKDYYNRDQKTTLLNGRMKFEVLETTELEEAVS